MSANAAKQNLRYAKVCERQNKKRYTGLKPEEAKYIKAKEQYEQAQRELGRFYRTAPRQENQSVDWDSLDDNTLDYFDHINKMSEKAFKLMSRLEEKINVRDTLEWFKTINCHSASF